MMEVENMRQEKRKKKANVKYRGKNETHGAVKLIDKNSSNNENFIMLPMVDFCFKELMNNEKVRLGFIAAVLGKEPSQIRRTIAVTGRLLSVMWRPVNSIRTCWNCISWN